MTNFEAIKSMTEDEMAVAFAWHCEDCYANPCPAGKLCRESGCKEITCSDAMLAWLREEVTDEWMERIFSSTPSVHTA